MKFDRLKITVCFFIALVTPMLLFAADTTVANAYYAKGQYKQAAEGYQQLVNEGYQSDALYFNLGNAYYKLGNIPGAVLYYEKARLLSPGDDDINFNIRLANSKTIDKIEPIPEFFITQWWEGFILGFSANTLAAWSIVCVLLASAALTVYFFSKAVLIKKTAFYTSIALFLLGIFAVFITASQLNYFHSHKQAIIFTSTVDIKSGPGQQMATLFVLHEGTKIDVLEINNGWVKFKLANNHEGWVKLSAIREI